MKLSFSLPPKPKPKPKPKQSSSKPSESFNNDDDDSTHDLKSKPHYVTEFDDSKTLTDGPPNKLIIPTKPNEWGPRKKMKNLQLPSSDPELRFELEAPSNIDATDSTISYGLNVRTKDDNASTAPDTRNFDKDNEPPNDDDLPSQVLPPVEKDLVLRKFKDDLKNLPDDRGFDEFDDVPVEAFATAVLAGMGWSQGKGVGRNAKEDVKVKQYERRTGMGGLGFVPDIPDLRKRELNSDPQQHVSSNMAANGKDNRLSREKRDGGKDDRRKHDKRSRVEQRPSSHSHSHREEKSLTPVSWLTNHIRVRIISKDFKGGKLYRKKGKVVRVVGPTVCHISMDESGELIKSVDQDILETALPKRGGPVLVLYGKHMGAFGNLVEKDMDEETGVVQDAITHALLNVRLEQIAEYTGDPSYSGY